MKFTLKKSYFAIAFLIVSVITIFSFQNCSQTKFRSISSVTEGLSLPPVSPVCDPTKRLAAFENVQCLPPIQNQFLGRQFYDVTCNDAGQWSRQRLGPADYSQCANTCAAVRPSDIENIYCQAPNGSIKNGVQRYTVTCLQEGSWTRTISGAADYSACPMVCDSGNRPSTTSPVSCPAPNTNLLSAIQNYTVTCNANGSWARTNFGDVDYSHCPQSCDPALRPSNTANEKCPSSADIKAIRSYAVSCAANGMWSRTPTTLDTSMCSAPTCDVGNRPGTQDMMPCPAPNSSINLSKQNFTISCSGAAWVRTPTGLRDDSQCPRTCGTAPANDFTSLACQSPYQSTMQAKQNYSYICDKTTGQFARTILGTIDYSACPKSCVAVNPAVRQVVSCPAGMAGIAYQNYSSTCNTTTGQWTNPVATSVDNSGCSAVACSGTAPTNFDPVACPSPFQSRMDAKRMYAAATCVNGMWQRGAATGVIDSSSCPVNDCSASVNPGTEKDRGSCSGGATGNIYQTCSLTCTGTTYSQTNCSADNYSRCDCGPNSTYNSLTRSCVSTIVIPPVVNPPTVTCAAGSTDILSAANNVGTKTTCSFSWNAAQSGQPAVITRATNGGAISGQCGSNGDWINVSSSCPKPADVVAATCANGATNYPACNNLSCNAGASVGTLVCFKICKGIDIGQRNIPGYLINTVNSGFITDQNNITTGVSGTHFHPTLNHYAFSCNNGALTYTGPSGWCEYHVDQLGVDAECDQVLTAPVPPFEGF